MNYRTYRTISRGVWSIIALVMVPVGGLWACVHLITNELSREASYQHQYGDQWVEKYTQSFGSLSQARTRIGIGIVGIVGIIAASIWLVKALKAGGHASQKRAAPPHRHESTTGRRVRYKRNALLGIYFGVPGILVSVALAIFRLGIFAEHSDEVSLAIFIFMGAYCAVMSGCYWWLKAKEWNEALIGAGFLPLAIFLVPFVRLIVLTELWLLLAAMVMMPLILVVVVAVLPDKSSRRAPWERPQRDRKRSRV